jgi:hypothetical protein
LTIMLLLLLLLLLGIIIDLIQSLHSLRDSHPKRQPFAQLRGARYLCLVVLKGWQPTAAATTATGTHISLNNIVMVVNFLTFVPVVV